MEKKLLKIGLKLIHCNISIFLIFCFLNKKYFSYGSRHLAKLWSNSEQVSNFFKKYYYILFIFLKIKDLIKQIESFILLDLIGASKPRIYSYHEPTQWLFDRLVVIEKKLKGINM